MPAPSPTRPRWLSALPWALPLLALLATTWPLARAPGARLLGDPEVEAIEHLWTLWLGAHHGPLAIDTDLASFPLGYRWVLADPLNLLWFVPAAWASPVLGFHAVQVCNLLLAAFTAVQAGRLLLPERPPPAWASATLALAAPTLAGPLVSGMTEAATLWAAVLAALLLKPAAERGGAFIPAAALAGAAAGWAGPYTALYAALLAPLVLASLLPLVRLHPARTAGRLGLCLLPALALVSPVAWAVATQRPADLPGAVSMLPQVLASPDLPQSRYLGADPLSVLLPLPSRDDSLLQATWLGTAGLLLGLWGMRRARLLAALFMWSVVLGLGVYLQVGDAVPRVDGRVLLLPAGLLSLVLEPLGRAARWHRMLAVSAVLLAPAAAAGARALAARLPGRHLALPALVALLAAELLVLAPLPWPRPTQDATTPPLYAALDRPGAIIAIPKQPQRVEGMPRSPARALLWQTAHGRPIAERPMFQKTAPELHALRDAIRVAALHGDADKAARARKELARLGYAWIVHHDEPGNSVRADQLTRVLGTPDVAVQGGLAWRL